jgi:hypothetical protein
VRADGVDAVVTAGAQSQFDVSLEDETVFSKRLAGRFPRPGEIADLIAGRSS